VFVLFFSCLAFSVMFVWWLRRRAGGFQLALLKKDIGAVVMITLFLFGVIVFSV